MQVESTTNKLHEEVSTLIEELKKAEDLISKNGALKLELELLKNIAVPLNAFNSYKSLIYFTGYIGKNSLNLLKVELAKTTGKYLLFNSSIEKKVFVVLFVGTNEKE